MNVSINTKYNIGDEVWFADYVYDTFYPCKYSGKITEIDIEVANEQICVLYWVSVECDGYRIYEEYSEDVCFGTYEECTKWCENRN